MTNLDEAFEALGRPHSSAQAFIESVAQNIPVLVPEIQDDGSIDIVFTGGGDAQHEIIPRHSLETGQLAVNEQIYGHWGSTYQDNPYKYVAYGALALRTPDTLLGVSFHPPSSPGEEPKLATDASQLFLVKDSNLQSLVLGLAGTLSRPDMTNLPPEQQEKQIIRDIYGGVTTRLTAGLGAAFAANKAPVADTFKQINELAKSDSSLGVISATAEQLPEFSERATLTRYLLHQLNIDAILYDNEIALEESERLANKGVRPIGFDEMHRVVEESVEETVSTYERIGKYL